MIYFTDDSIYFRTVMIDVFPFYPVTTCTGLQQLPWMTHEEQPFPILPKSTLWPPLVCVLIQKNVCVCVSWYLLPFSLLFTWSCVFMLMCLGIFYRSHYCLLGRVSLCYCVLVSSTVLIIVYLVVYLYVIVSWYLLPFLLLFTWSCVFMLLCLDIFSRSHYSRCAYIS